MNNWYLESGNQSDIVFSSRVRFARNIKGFPFPNKMNDEQRYAVIQKVSDAVLKSSVGADYHFVDIAKLDENELFSMVERHLISPQFASDPSGRALILKNDESVSIMINEEDHLRIQCIKSGLELEKAYNEAEKLEKIIGESVGYAFDNKFGFLTECPTNLGTGMRASAMIHLPALESLGALNRIFNSLSQFGVAIRGTFGEGSKIKNSMYQISNQITLGISEKDAIDNINSIINGLIQKEKEARKNYNEKQLEDTVYRALGTLKYARMLSSEEFSNLISKLRLGVSMNLIDIPITLINELSLVCGKAAVSVNLEHSDNPSVRDTKRAEKVRERLKDYM